MQTLSKPGLHSSRPARSRRSSLEPAPLAGTTSRSGAANPRSPSVAFGLLDTVAFWGALQSRQLSATTGRCLRCGASVGESANGRFGPTPGSLSAFRAANDCANASIWADSAVGAISILRNTKTPQKRGFGYRCKSSMELSATVPNLCLPERSVQYACPSFASSCFREARNHKHRFFPGPIDVEPGPPSPHHFRHGTGCESHCLSYSAQCRAFLA